MDINRIFFGTNKRQAVAEKGACMFSDDCEQYTSGKKCRTPEIYETEPCYAEKRQNLNRAIAENTYCLFGDIARQVPVKTNNTPMSPKQMETLAKTTNALFNGGHLLAS
jgi:hypothetical protein